MMVTRFQIRVAIITSLGCLWGFLPVARAGGICAGDANGDGRVDPLDAGFVSARLACVVGAGNTECDAADQNGDGLVDPLDLGYVQSRFGPCPADGPIFGNPEFPVGDDPQSVALGDLDGDGDLDMVTANEDSDDISVLFNTGHGLFSEEVRYAAGDGPRVVALGDLDMDGDLDVAVANYNTDDVSILFNLDQGLFAPHADHGVSDKPSAIAIGDLDGDGLPDVVTAGGGGVSVLFNKGGAFEYEAVYAFGAPASVALGDLDGDGDLDVAIDEFSYVSLLFNAGDGTFSAPQKYYWYEGPEAVGLADFDNDGDLDLAATAAEYDYGPVAIWLNNGDGSFADENFYGVGKSPLALAMGDVDGDGDIDIVTSNNKDDTVSILPNLGDGTFFYDTLVRPGLAPTAVALGDLDGDGSLDMVVPHGGDRVSVILNDSEGTFGDHRDYPAGPKPAGIVWCDLDADGDQDLVLGDAEVNQVLVLIQTWWGAFAPAVSYTVGGEPYAIACGDLNADGYNDVVVTNSWASSDHLSVLLNQGDGTLSEAVSYSTGYSPWSVALGDLDGDGDLDVAAGTYDLAILLNRGDGSFDDAATYPTSIESQLVALGDLDGDEDLDVTAIHWDFDTPGDIAFLLNQGDGSFADEIVFDFGIDTIGFALGDLNNDELVDVAIAEYEADSLDGSVHVLLNQGNANLSAPVTYPVGIAPYSVAIGDINGDGLPDIVTPDWGSEDDAASLYVLLNSGSGAFVDSARYGMTNGPWFLALGDMDNDGDLDLAAANSGYGGCCNPDGNVSILTNQTIQSEPITDCDDNNQPDDGPDCNTNGLPDACDIATLSTFASALAENTTYWPDWMFLGPPDNSTEGIGSDYVTYELTGAYLFDGPGPDLTVYRADDSLSGFDTTDVLISGNGENFVSIKLTEGPMVRIPGDEGHIKEDDARSYDISYAGFEWVRYVRVQGGYGLWGAGGVDAIGLVYAAGSLDCNGNSIPDECDIATGISLDINVNGISDDCEDCNGNGVLDEMDISSGTSQDCNASGLPDECEPDCNANGVADTCDLANGTGGNCNGNTILDECDIASGYSLDCNANVVPDDCDLAGGSSSDCNANGIPDDCDTASGASADCNANVIPDECEVDCNGNSVPDDCDVADADCNGNGTPDDCETDCNDNWMPDDCDLANQTSPDCNGNLVPDECDVATAPAFPFNIAANTTSAPDSKFVGPPDDAYAGINLGTVTYNLEGSYLRDSVGPDLNVYEHDSGLVEFTQIDVLVSADGLTYVSVKSTEGPVVAVPGDEAHSNDNFARSYEVSGTGFLLIRYVTIQGTDGTNGGFDLDAIGLISAFHSMDCNDNGTPDECDVDGGASSDTNDNGIPDECEAPPTCDGDANGDGVVDPLDSGYVQARFGCTVDAGDGGCDAADVNADGLVDPLDVGYVLARFGECK